MIHSDCQANALRSRQRGFTMVELLVVLAIIAVLAIFGIPMAKGVITGGKVEPTASDVSKTVAKIRGNFGSTGAAPYTAMSGSIFASAARGLTSSITVDGTTATHDLGTGTITVAPATIAVAGDSYTVAFGGVSDAACPDLAAQLSKSAEVILVNGTSVKANSNAVFNAAAAQGACVTGDAANLFTFTFR